MSKIVHLAMVVAIVNSKTYIETIIPMVAKTIISVASDTAYFRDGQVVTRSHI